MPYDNSSTWIVKCSLHCVNENWRSVGRCVVVQLKLMNRTMVTLILLLQRGSAHVMTSQLTPKHLRCLHYRCIVSPVIVSLPCFAFDLPHWWRSEVKDDHATALHLPLLFIIPLVELNDSFVYWVVRKVAVAVGWVIWRDHTPPQRVSSVEVVAFVVPAWIHRRGWRGRWWSRAYSRRPIADVWDTEWAQIKKIDF